MKKVLAVLGVLFVAIISWRFAVRPSAAMQAYQSFAIALAAADEVTALGLCDGEEAREAVRTQGHVQMLPFTAEALSTDRFRILSEKKFAGTEVTIEAVQVVAFDPAGTQTALGAGMTADFRQVARLRKTASGWRVASFRNEFVSVGKGGAPRQAPAAGAGETGAAAAPESGPR